MIPIYPVNNFVYCCFSYAKHFRKLLLCKISTLGHASYLNYLFFIQYCHRPRVLGTEGWVVFSPSLRIHIMNVLNLTSKSKVIGITAQRIVALVKNTHSQWNRSFICQNPRNSMRKCWIFKNLTCLKLSITHTILRPFPVPAFIRSKNFYFRPKIDHKIFRQKLLKLFRGNNLCSHSVSFVNCLPRSRLFVQREGTLFYTA